MDKKVKILINGAKIVTKEILCECEETLETMNEVIYAGAYVVTEKLNGKPKKFTNRRVRTKPCWKERIEKKKKWTEKRGVNTWWINKRSKGKVKNTE